MSIPATRKRQTSYTVWTYGALGDPPTVRTDTYVTSDVESSTAYATRTPFVYRGPTIIVDGELRVDGEKYGGDAANHNQTSFKSFKSMKGKKRASYADYLLYTRNMWRNPTPYTVYLVEGMVGSIQATMVDYFNRGDHRIQYAVVGECTFGILETYLTKTVPLPIDSSLENRAVIKVLGKLKRQQVNLSNAFGERKQTVELVAGTLSRLTHAARSLHRGDIGGVVRSLGLVGHKKAPVGRNFHEKWLELQYGWKPLYADVFGAVQALHEKDHEDPQRYMFSATAEVKNLVKIQNIYRGLTVADERIEGAQGCFIRLDYYVDNPLLKSLSQLGITNPLETTWEVTPVSFIWDWFNPVGQYLTSIDASLGKSLRGGSITNWSKSHRYIGLSGSQNSDTRRECSGTGNARTVNMSRRVITDFPQAHYPGFKNPFPGPRNPQHLQNLIALFASSARGRKIARH